MYSDVIDLRDFYATALGQVARQQIGRRLRGLWPNTSGLRVLGLGYATPYLRLFADEAERVVSFMPAPQGVLHWPRDGRNLTGLVSENELPLRDYSIDRVLLIHALECAEQVRPMLAEIWRVLSGGGRLVVVVPNRRGVWARMDRTPFGNGSPYTQNQLTRLLREAAFTPLVSAPALFVPPTDSRMVLGAAGAWEKLGERYLPGFSGVVTVEAAKQIHAPMALEKAPRRQFGYAGSFRPAPG